VGISADSKSASLETTENTEITDNNKNRIPPPSRQ
jgi:hypothetical protein